MHKRMGIKNSNSAVRFFTQHLEACIGLGNIYDLLNYEEGTEQECLFKMAFLAFFRWYVKEKFPVHVLTAEKILDKNKKIIANMTSQYLKQALRATLIKTLYKMLSRQAINVLLQFILNLNLWDLESSTFASITTVIISFIYY